MHTIKILVLSFFCSFLSFAQTHHKIITPTIENSIAEKYDEQTYQTTYEFSGENYGYTSIHIIGTDPPLYTYYHYHTAYKFSLTSIPSDAYNINVFLEVYRSYGTGDSKIVSVPDDLNFNNLEECWSQADQGSEYFTVDLTPGTMHDVTSLVIPRIAQNYINFGARESNLVLNEYGEIDIYMHIYYDLPISITAQNNFINGTIKVGVDEPPTQQNSPFQFSANVGQTVNLEAQNQFYGSYERVWNDYAPLNQSNWLKNGAFFSNIIAPSFTVAQNDDNSTYEAGLRKNFKIDQTHKFEFDPEQTQQNTT